MNMIISLVLCSLLLYINRASHHILPQPIQVLSFATDNRITCLFSIVFIYIWTSSDNSLLVLFPCHLILQIGLTNKLILLHYLSMCLMVWFLVEYFSIRCILYLLLQRLFILGLIELIVVYLRIGLFTWSKYFYSRTRNFPNFRFYVLTHPWSCNAFSVLSLFDVHIVFTSVSLCSLLLRISARISTGPTWFVYYLSSIRLWSSCGLIRRNKLWAFITWNVPFLSLINLSARNVR